ncbi:MULTISPECIES: hypothetical protein [Pyrobaculum]|uniref:Uncharacterized protein n=2 Tax=Pyrobaculum arsenaticum TaxID=121277 RepID=A4WHK7_PYRAR|nr:hypothetical protein [Pyrobaculum arsenaticum]ABP49874.1 hypothetical protein Pars_0261 [Pyrobaculum arsenaticum DSM 13514]NYR15861.1 hypothetical protein [Pyrobaculum arsenaticum]
MNPPTRCAEALRRVAHVRPGAVRDAFGFAFAFSLLFTPFYLLGYFIGHAFLAFMKSFVLIYMSAFLITSVLPHRWASKVVRDRRNYLGEVLTTAIMLSSIWFGSEFAETFSAPVAVMPTALSLYALVSGDEERQLSACLFLPAVASGVVVPSWAAPAWFSFALFVAGLDAVRRGSCELLLY